MAECHFVGWHSALCYFVKCLSAECCSTFFILVTFCAIIYFQWQNVILLVGILLCVLLSSVFQLNVVAPFLSCVVLCNNLLSMAECHFVGWRSAECCSTVFILVTFYAIIKFNLWNDMWFVDILLYAILSSVFQLNVKALFLFLWHFVQ